jgi:hypothetical protein
MFVSVYKVSESIEEEQESNDAKSHCVCMCVCVSYLASCGSIE